MSDVMTKRDQFAMALPSDEIGTLTYNNLSVQAQERLTGCKYPLKDEFPSITDYQLAMLEFNCEVSAAVRFKYADILLARSMQAGGL